jgi:hypothetical protein
MLVFCVLVWSAFACNSSSNGESSSQPDTSALNSAQNRSIITAIKLPASELPASIKFRGSFQDAWQWKDNNGEHILVTSYVQPYRDKKKNEMEEDGETAELHAFHFQKKDTAYKLLWKIADAERSCPFDITTEFIKESTTITDLDNDGIAETTVAYKLACRSDVSPASMKIILYEDTMKYTLRGLMWLKASPDDKFTVTADSANLEKMPKKNDEYERYLLAVGRYENEKDFKSAPPEFLEYAKKKWMQHVVENID